jgi:choline-sulfatase
MASQQPNVLFLLSDEHSFRFMGHCPEERGGEPAVTPTFDRLAANGTVFTDAYCRLPPRCILPTRQVS